MNFDIKHTLKESQGVALTELQTTLGKVALQRGLTNQFTTNIETLKRRANNVLLLRAHFNKVPEDATTISDLYSHISKCESIFEKSSNQEWKDKTSEQIFFESGGNGEFLNQIPGLVATLVFMKLWLAPVLALATPFIMFILPFFMLKYVYNMPMPWSVYQKMALNMFIGSEKLNLNSVGRILYFIASLSQTIIQPFITAIAVRKLDALVHKRADELAFCRSAVVHIFKIFRAAKIKVPNLPGEASTSAYNIFATDKDQRWTTEYLGNLLGDSEVLFVLSQELRFKKATFLPNNSSTILEINGLHDISISSDPKKSNIKFTTTNQHSLLTGPNRGGKSSNLRAVLQNVLWAQTYGLAPSTYKGKCFEWIISSLRVEDRPGLSSLFEREIEIATEILKRGDTSLGLVLIDEIFHSTNPPDGEKSARIFLEKLWDIKNIVSCVSTHVYKIVEDAPEYVQKLCCYAEEDANNTIYYSYTLQEGICKVSSVNEVLHEKGLLR